MANPLRFEIQIGSQLATDIDKLKAKLNELVQNRTIKIGVDDKLGQITQQLVQSFRDINQQQMESSRNLKAVTEYIQQQQKSLSGVAEAQKGVVAAAKAQAEALKEEEKAQKKAERAKKQSANASEQLAKSENTAAQAIANATKEARGQSQVVSDLKSLMLQYFSVYGAQRFLTEMVNITGELELQRKSLEVILGSGTAASEMYTQLRDLSQQSPYTFEDLLKAHRQLAAFGIEAKDIYGTMKSLTDIGAGLDVPVERLILAYGHTRSYGYLSGIQNRQFETAGIDLVGALADLYNRRADTARQNGQAASYVSRKDIFALMRKRDIPFEDVQEVIMDLDKPGGKFYNMQERQYDTLGGKIRNLRNNYRIMLSEMGGSSRGIWMGLVNTLNEVTEHWGKYANMLFSVATAYGLLKAAHMTADKAVLSQGAAISRVMAGINATKWSSAILGNAPAASLSTAEKKPAGNAIIKEIANNKALTDLQKRRIALGNQLTIQQRARLLYATGLDGATSRRIAQFGRLRRSVLSLRLGFIQAATAAKAFVASMLPQLGIMAGITAITAFVSHSMEITRKAADMARQFREDSEANAKSADEILQGYAQRGIIDLNPTTRYDAMGNKLTDNRISLVRDKNGVFANGADLSSDIEEMKKKLQVLSPIYNGDLLDIDKMEGQEKQFEAIVNKIEAIRKANEVQESIAADLANADKRVAGGNGFTRMFADTFSENASDYYEAVKDMREKLQDAFTNTESEYYTSDEALDYIDKASGGLLTAIREGKGLSNHREALQEYFGRVAKMTEDERNRALRWMDSIPILGGYQSLGGLYRESSGTNSILGRSLQSQYAQLKKGAATWSRSLGEDIISNFAKDPESAAAAMINSVNSFTSSVTDPSVKQSIADILIANLKKRSDFTVSGKYGDLTLQNTNIGDLYAQALVKEKFGQYLSGLKGSMNDVEAGKIFDEACKKIENFIREHNITIRELGGKTAKEWFKGLYEGRLNSLRANEAWQKRALDTIKTDQELKMKINASVDIYAFAEDVRNKIKETRDRIEKMIPHIKALQVRLGIKFNLSAETSAEEINKQIKYLETKLRSDEGHASIVQLDLEKELIKQYQELATATSSLSESMGWNKKEGFNDEDEEKRLKKLDEAKHRREAADRKADQTAIKNLEARYNAIRKVYEWYKRWYDLLGNSDAAMDAAKKLVDASDIKGIDLNDLKSWDTYVKLLERERDAAGKTKLRLPKENADRIKQIQTNYTDTIDRGDADEFSRNQDRTASALGRQLEVLGKQYGLYKKIYELTGERDLAVRLSGRSAANASQSKADDYRQAIQAGLDEARRSLGLGAFSLDFDKLFGMDDEKIKETVGTILNIDDEGKVLQNNKQLALQYKAIAEALKEWRDLQEQINSEGKETYASLVGGLQDYDSVVARNNGEYQRAIDKINAAKDLSADDKARAETIASQNKETKNLQASLGYINLINRAVSMGDADFVANLAKAEADLGDRLKANTVSAADYATEMRRLRDIEQKRKESGFFGTNTEAGAFVQRGLPGLRDFYNGKADARRAELAGNHYTREQIENDSEVRKWEARSEKVNSVLDGLGDLGSVVGIVTDTFDGLQQAAQSLSTMFDALGNESMANFFSDFSDVAGGIGSVFTPVSNVIQNAVSGNVGGLVSSAISAPFQMIASPVTAFAQLHDKRNQRAIDKLQESVSRIEGYEKVIATAQKRTLGYDGGSYIRQMQEYYAGNDYAAQRQALISVFGKTGTYTYTETGNKEGAAGKAMAKYYAAAGGGDISGYEQQYNLLVQERQDYINMYNAEDGKKKKSKASLREYKEKIAELDDQIRYFAEDLANTLYGIDLKSWADQLGDALMTAFENGEDAAEAFDDSVTSILQGIAKNMIVTSVIEPKLDQLRTKLFGTNGTNGSFDAARPDSNRAGWMADINEALGDNGYVRESMEGAKVLFDSMESLANGYGNTLMNSDSASMSSSVKGITEQAGDLLAAYLNAIRADVSVMRQLYGSKAVAYMDAMSVMARSQVQYQSQIAANTLRNAQAAESIVQTQNNIIYILNAVVNDSKQFNVRVK